MGTSERLPWGHSEVNTQRSAPETRLRYVKKAGLWQSPQVRWEPEPAAFILVSKQQG